MTSDVVVNPIPSSYIPGNSLVAFFDNGSYGPLAPGGAYHGLYSELQSENYRYPSDSQVPLNSQLSIIDNYLYWEDSENLTLDTTSMTYHFRYGTTVFAFKMGVPAKTIKTIQYNLSGKAYYKSRTDTKIYDTEAIYIYCVGSNVPSLASGSCHYERMVQIAYYPRDESLLSYSGTFTVPDTIRSYKYMTILGECNYSDKSSNYSQVRVTFYSKLRINKLVAQLE